MAGINESVNTIEGCNAAFDTNDFWYLPWIVPVIGIESMVPRARLTLGICSLIKPAAMNLSTDLALKQYHYVRNVNTNRKETL